MQIGGFAAQTRAVVHHLGGHLHRAVVEKNHVGPSQKRGSQHNTDASEESPSAEEPPGNPPGRALGCGGGPSEPVWARRWIGVGGGGWWTSAPRPYGLRGATSAAQGPPSSHSGRGALRPPVPEGDRPGLRKGGREWGIDLVGSAHYCRAVLESKVSGSASLDGLRFSVVGPGRVGKSVTGWAVAAGAELVAVAGRDGLAAFGSGGQDLLLIAVPDGVLAEVAERLATRPQAGVALHTSGSRDAAVLAPLRAAGAAGGTLAPPR